MRPRSRSSRIAAWLPLAALALAGLLACGGETVRSSDGARADGGRPEPVRFEVEPTIRVGVAWGDTAVTVGGAGRWWIRERGVARPIAVVESDEAWAVARLPFETALRVIRPDGWVSQPHAVDLVASPLGPAPLEVDGVAYPGDVELALDPDGAVTAVNVVPIETYLEGVVAKELGGVGPDARAALEAQAVAARTYALRRLGSRAAEGFDVYGSILDQAYAGVAGPADSAAVAAVRATRGEALLHDGALIQAYYHSTCGGSTARVDLVFDAPAEPYLVPVSDERPEGGFWCQPSRYFRWTVSWNAEELQAMIERNLPDLVPLPPAGPGRLRDLTVGPTSPSGRVLSMRVETSTGGYRVSGGNAIRRLFAGPEGRWLRSTLFLYRPEREGPRLVAARLTGGGWGHGVGMCQVGAMERARAGHGRREILATYYPGTRAATVYP